MLKSLLAENIVNLVKLRVIYQGNNLCFKLYPQAGETILGNSGWKHHKGHSGHSEKK